jgi:alpha-L-fucosidase
MMPMKNSMGRVLKKTWRTELSALACIAAAIAGQPEAVAQTTYTASWSSLDTHNPAPEWFQDAKFGIYYHWGAFGVAEFGSEWYPRNMYNKGGNSAEYQHHMSTYGDPFGNWPYNNFLSGANDKSGKFTQFAPKLVSDGGNWDPDAWAQLFADSGARFAGPVAEHHDGFSMWDSKVNPWNSVAYGPKLNLGKLQADAIRKKGLKLLMSQHTAYNFTGYYQYAPAQSDSALQQLFGQLPKAQEETIWLGKLKELIDEFLPDVIWQDFNLNQISDANLTNFLAYYYNAAAKAGVDVVATAKDGIATAPPGTHKGQVYDYERGGPGDITTPYWLTDDAVSSSSWCYTQGMGYYAVNAEVHTFVDHVSKGGNLLLNISPLPDGTIPQQQKDILNGFGTFLNVAGEAIYATRAWTVYGEGPTKIGGGSFTGPKAMTASDIRYTKSKNGDAVYAILGGWPSGGQVNMTAVTTSRFPLGSGKVFLFGPAGGQPTTLQATQDTSGLHVTLPGTAPYTAIAYAIKISPSSTPPGSSPTIDAGVPSTGGSGGSTDAGAAGAGGNPGSGGRSGAGGTTTTSSGTGGAPGSGGASGAGGARSSGGGAGSGGASGTGGAGSTGGAPGSGGASGAGGARSSGGAASGGASTSTMPGGSGGVASGGISGNAGAGGAAGSSGNVGSGGTLGAGGATGTTTVTTRDSGCSCATNGRGRNGAGGSLLLLGLSLASLLRRRRR